MTILHNHSIEQFWAGALKRRRCTDKCCLRMQEGVRTFSVRVGVENVFWTCIALLEVAYAAAIGVGLVSQVWTSHLPRIDSFSWS